MNSSQYATASKQQFVNVWNPIAQTYGLRQYREPDI
jgi:hypothetical protein